MSTERGQYKIRITICMLTMKLELFFTIYPKKITIVLLNYL